MSIWPNGLGVWFVLWVHEVRGSNPRLALIFYWLKTQLWWCEIDKGDYEKVCQKWDSNPRPQKWTATWTQRLRPLGHPDQWWVYIEWSNGGKVFFFIFQCKCTCFLHQGLRIKYFFSGINTARLAQSVEHETLNLRVVGSSPTLGGYGFAKSWKVTGTIKFHSLFVL